MVSLGMLLIRTCEADDAKSPLRMSHKIRPNPSFLKTSRRKGHETEWKAFVMSSLRRMLAVFVDEETLLFGGQA